MISISAQQSTSAQSIMSFLIVGFFCVFTTHLVASAEIQPGNEVCLFGQFEEPPDIESDDDQELEMDFGDSIAACLNAICPADTVECTSPCPTGYTQVGTECIVPPIPLCPPSGTYSESNNRCERPRPTIVGSCSMIGWSTCSGNKCCRDAEYTCPDGFALDGTECKMIGNAVCPSGTYRDGGLCVRDATPSYTCPSGFYFNDYHLDCERYDLFPNNCPPGSDPVYSDGVCVTQATITGYTCPSGFTQEDNKCYRNPTGVTCPTGFTQEGTYCLPGLAAPVCPLGSDRQCADIHGNGRPVCSPHDCFVLEEDDDEFDDSQYHDDGPRDAYGQCLGELFFFNGNVARCRPTGIKALFGCCKVRNPEGVMHAVSGCSASEYIPWRNRGSYYPIVERKQVSCTDPETGQQTTCMSIIRSTHPLPRTNVYLGKRCITRWTGVGCVQRQRVYCQFDSMFARIIQEGGRKQLPGRFDQNNPFGTPSSPNCRGFTPEEFEMINMSAIDMSEFQEYLMRGFPGEIDEDGNVISTGTTPPTFTPPDAGKLLQDAYKKLEGTE